MGRRSNQGQAASYGLTVPSLLVASFATWPAVLVLTLLLVDIGQTFGSPVGITGQVQTLSSGVAVVSALLMGALSVRFNLKALMLAGLLLIAVSVLGCALSSSFFMLLAMYSITGIGMAIVGPLTITLVGELFPVGERTRVIGWAGTAATLSSVIGAPMIGYLAGFGGWRLAFLAYVLPISILGLILAAKGLPSTFSGYGSTGSGGSLLGGFRGVLSNRSAVASLLGTVLTIASWQSINLYSTAFYRQRYLVSTSLVSTFVTIGSILVSVGAMIGSSFVDRYGRKPVTVISGLVCGICMLSYMIMPSFWLSLAPRFLVSISGGVMYTAMVSLALEQVPGHRGAMMSLNSASMNLGSALGAAVGGFTLLLYDYGFVGVILGSFLIFAVIVYQMLVVEP